MMKNYYDIVNKMLQMQRQCMEQGRNFSPIDDEIKALIMRIYLTDPQVDYEECIWLWDEFLHHARLDFSQAKKMGRMRLAKEVRA